jgi:hypothetical protein
VPTLSSIQANFRDALVNQADQKITSCLTSIGDPSKRLTIHKRNYETSLVKALLTKFPATQWLVGTNFLTEAARRYIHNHPPQAPCIAEYGEQFPMFLSEWPAADRVPYLAAFSRLEWHIGHVAIAIEEPAFDFDTFSTAAMPQAVLMLQSGVRYLQASWPVDDLMKVYLSETPPDCFEMMPADVCIEVRGARGDFQINRLGTAEFIFRKSILGLQSIEHSADRALNVDDAFDPGQALARLIEGGYVCAVAQSRAGKAS